MGIIQTTHVCLLCRHGRACRQAAQLEALAPTSGPQQTTWPPQQAPSTAFRASSRGAEIGPRALTQWAFYLRPSSSAALTQWAAVTCAHQAQLKQSPAAVWCSRESLTPLFGGVSGWFPQQGNKSAPALQISDTGDDSRQKEMQL